MFVTLLAAVVWMAPQDAVPVPTPEPAVRLDHGLAVHLGEVGDANAVALALLLPVGLDHDPADASGLAVAAAEYRLLGAASALPPQVQGRHEVHGPFTLFLATVPRERLGDGVAWCARLLAEPATAVDGPRDAAECDRMALALARAALWADDAAAVYPGPVLLGRLRHALLGGAAGARGEAGSAEELQRITPDAVRAWIARCHGPAVASLALVGGVAAGALDRELAVLAQLPARGERPPPVVRAPAGDLPALLPLAGVGGAFAAAGFRAPPPTADALAFALGMEVLRGRAARAFVEHRGGEAEARAPFLSWSFGSGAPLVMVCRRGVDGSEADAPRHELAALLADVAERPPQAGEQAAARRLLQSQFLLPPYPRAWQEALRAEPAGLEARARTLALATHWGWPADLGARLQQVPDAAVARALAEATAPAGLAWAGVLPRSRTGR